MAKKREKDINYLRFLFKKLGKQNNRSLEAKRKR